MKDQKIDFEAAEGEEIVSDSRCFVCGLKNVGGLQVRFFRTGDRTARAECTPERAFMGYDGLVHGGVTASLLDEVMIKAVLGRGEVVVTARMTVNYHRPVPMGEKLMLTGEITADRRRMFDTVGHLYDSKGTKLASATGTYVKVTGAERERLMASIGN